MNKKAISLIVVFVSVLCIYALVCVGATNAYDGYEPKESAEEWAISELKAEIGDFEVYSAIEIKGFADERIKAFEIRLYDTVFDTAKVTDIYVVAVADGNGGKDVDIRKIG